jgi:neutral ceramidase
LSELTAGVAAVDITPPVGIDLCGFGNRAGPSTGVHDELYAKALYLRNGGQALIITCDLVGLDYASIRLTRAGIAKATGMSADEIMIGCSHTHSGPGTPCLPTLGRTDDEYMAVLIPRLVSAGQLAHSRAQPARAGHNQEQVAVGINRRQVTWGTEPGDGSSLGVHVDHVDVLAIDSADGPLARLFIHPAHGVTLGGDNLLISADWMGYAQRFVEQLEPGSVALFGQGCCGNINSHPRGTFEIAEAQGRAMAGAVLKASELAPMSDDILIGAAHEQFRLPCFNPPPVAEAQAILDENEAQLEKSKSEGEYGGPILYEGMVKWARWLVEMSEQQATGLAIDYEAQAFRIGNFAVVGLPGEVFCEYAINIAARSPFEQTAVMAYTNGNPGYIPTAAAYKYGGYEVEGAYRFYCGGYSMITAESERLIMDAVERLLKRLAGSGTQ